jgi:hypothetical protein
MTTMNTNSNAGTIRILFGILALSAVAIIILVLDRRNQTSTQQLVTAPISAATTVNAADLRIVTGQTVFVPAYAEIAWTNADTVIALTATLAIHNTDPNTPIIIRSVRYYDTNGTLVRDFITDPVQLGPLATSGYVVPADASGGGWGTNFLVEWGAESPVYEPVVEALMMSDRGSVSVSFISSGRVVAQVGAQITPEAAQGTGE